ncbi:wax ester/triacylglycerol synthase domain-containing protein [Streptomyces cadmiisoli]|uniref:wax ester/triacylglycerol synthase domain-containing protein n=1 Tax=Streptomyces cadmiisoli TaxID=2184053 RepID=UPI0018F00259|nr:wax ester/triacylglycerol synthase domain-containing protein [Streptomyces cadmiisoli]
MLRSQPGTDGHLPPTLPMGAADIAYHLATRGRPLPVAFVFAFTGRAPSLDALRARVAERAHHIPALRYGIERRRRRLVLADRVAVERHVHEAWLSDDTDGSGTGRLMLARPMTAEGRPPWQVWLVHGPDGGYTLGYRSDHTLQDGVGAAHTARALLDDHPDDGPPGHPCAWPTARGVADALRDVTASLRAPVAKPAFAMPVTGRTRVCHADTALTRLRLIGREHGGTVNDVYLAALAHAVRVWHLKETGTAHPPLPVAVPMSVRAAGEETAPGNRMVVARLLLPCDEVSPKKVLARTVAATGRMRTSRQRDAVRLMLAAAPRAFGGRIGTRLVNGAVVAGPASSVNFGDALVHQGAASRRAAVFSELAAGVRMMTTLTGQRDTACLTLVHDEALRNAGDLPDLWLAALRELERA